MEKKKANFIKTALQAIFVITLGYFIRHKSAETGAQVWVAAGWLLTAWVVLRLALTFKRAYSKYRMHTKSGFNLETIDKLSTESLPPLGRAYYVMEKKVYRGVWRTITLKPLLPAGEFSVAGGPTGRRLATVLLLVVAVCGIAATIYLPPLATGFWPRLWAFAGSIFTALYAAIWIVGGRRNLKEGGHRITNDALIVDLGIRCSGVIALDSIAACRKLEQSERHSAASDAWIVSPGEAANVLIELDGMTTLEIMTWGWPRQVSKRFVALYVDEPDLFVHAVSQACGRARNSVA